MVSRELTGDPMDRSAAAEIPAVVVAKRDGTVIDQNTPARRLMGAGRGESCWDVVGGVKNAEGLPCAEGCVRELLAAGMERSRHTRFKLAGQRHHLSCIPVGEVVVCMLSHSTGELPEPCEDLTPRERDVLESLAEGETTSSAARQLGIRESTLRTHVEKMRIKAGVNTRAALVALGFRLGYLS
jgi:DNA-binding CsgD family transcriptional regulator